MFEASVADFSSAAAHAAFGQLIARVKADAQDPAVVQDMVRKWQHEVFDQLDEKQQMDKYRAFVGEVLPEFLGIYLGICRE